MPSSLVHAPPSQSQAPRPQAGSMLPSAIAASSQALPTRRPVQDACPTSAIGPPLPPPQADHLHEILRSVVRGLTVALLLLLLLLLCCCRCRRRSIRALLHAEASVHLHLRTHPPHTHHASTLSPRRRLPPALRITHLASAA
ncbi:hypothetical protein ACJQWK_05562 [Exserohilum turcicum]